MSEVKLSAQNRTEFGKGAARRARRDGLVPAVLYGHGSDPIHVSLPGHDTLLALRVPNALLAISIDGARPQLALPKQVQRNPIRGNIEHVDLVIVKKGEKVTVEVPLVVSGDDRPDRIVVIDLQTIALEVEATHIPAHVDVDVSALEAGSTVHAKDVVLPAGATLAGDPAAVVLSVTASKTQEQIDAELDAATAEASEGGAAVVEEAE